MKTVAPPPRGFGKPAGELAREMLCAAGAAIELEGVISGFGDLLLVFAVALERLGLPRPELIRMCDLLLEEHPGDDNPRGSVPRAMRSRLLSREKTIPLPDFRVIAGGRQGAPNAGDRS